MERVDQVLRVAYYALCGRFYVIHNTQHAIFRSIRFRLTMWYVFILALVLLVFGSIVYASQAQSMGAELRDNLRSDAERLATNYDPATGRFNLPTEVKAQDGTGSAVRISPGELKVLASVKGKMAVGSNDIVLTLDLNGVVGQQLGPVNGSEVLKLLTGILATRKSSTRSNVDSAQASEALKKLDAAKKAGQDVSGIAKSLNIAPQSPNPDQAFFFYTLTDGSASTGATNHDYLFYSTPILVKTGMVGTLILGRPREDETQLNRLLVTLLLATPATLLMTALGGYWLATRAMRPVRAITRAAREIGETELGRRLNLQSKDELGELASTFDGMLDRLEAAFQRQRQFTADASHELRTPLTIVNLEVNHALALDDGRWAMGPELAKDGRLERRRLSSANEEYRRALAIIQGENDYMARLVNNLIVLARADAGQALDTHEVIDLSDVALEVIERLDPLARRNGVVLQTGALPELRVAGDRLYLGQMLANLVENAIKYSDGCSANQAEVPSPRLGHTSNWVRVETGSILDGDKPSAWVRVEDNGRGIPPQHLPRLFDRFYRVDQARSHNESATGKGESGGSGLGLSIVQWVAQAHGGEVRVESDLGVGSLFEVRLPLVG